MYKRVEFNCECPVMNGYLDDTENWSSYIIQVFNREQGVIEVEMYNEN